MQTDLPEHHDINSVR